jgi:hypothetical protein
VRGQLSHYSEWTQMVCMFECDKLLFLDRSLVPGYGNSPVEHKRDNSWLGGAIAVQDNGAHLLVRCISLRDFLSSCLLLFFV